MFRFTLTFDGVSTVIDEPRGFNEYESQIERDFKTHGMFYQFTKGTLKLGFKEDARTILLNAYEVMGDDAEVTLTVERRYEDWQTWTTIYTGTAIIANRDVDLDFFNVDFEETGFIQDIMNNLDTPLDLGLTKDLKGNTIAALNPQNINLYPKKLLNTYSTRIADGTGFTTYTDSDTDTGTSFNKFLSINLDDFISGQLTGWQPGAMTETIVRQTAFSTRLLTEANYINSVRGDLTFNSQLKIECNLTATFLASGNHSSYVNVYLYKDGSPVGTFFSDSDFVLGGTSITINTGVVTMDADISQTGLFAEALNKYAIVFIFNGTAAASTNITLDIDLDVYDSSIFNISALSTTDATTCDTYSILRTLRRAVEIATGVPAAVYSDYFGLTNDGNISDGCGAINFITNGYRLRGIDREPVIKIREFLSSLQAMFGVGWSVENNTYDIILPFTFQNDPARILITGDDFRGFLNGSITPSGTYSNDETFTFDSSSYEDGVMILFVNEAPTDETTDATFTISGRLLRVEPLDFFYNDAELFALDSVADYKERSFEDLLFNEIEIGYSKIADDETDANTLDDYNTITNYATPLKKVKGKYSQVSDIIASPYLLEITRRVQFNEGDNLSTRYDDDLFIINTYRSTETVFIPISDEEWTTITGIIDETSTYNLALNPLYMLFKHNLLVNSVAKGKNGLDEYINTFYKNNGSVVLDLTGTNTCLSSTISTASFTLDQDVTLNQLNGSSHLFEPTLIEFTTNLSDQEIADIKEALQGSDTGTYTKYGYITLPDNDGNTVSGWIMEMPYNISNGICNFTLLKRYAVVADNRVTDADDQRITDGGFNRITA
jgi:hypothetical protein